MRAAITSACVLSLVVVFAGTAMGGNGVPAPAPAPAAAPRTPEEMAVEAYNGGLQNRNRGLKAEEQLARAAKPADRAKHEKKAREEYTKALKSFKRAAELNPQLPQAWNGIGFASRKLGDFTAALDSYDRALQLAPNFPDAIEYRAEAYLALNRIADAKAAYLTLFALDRPQAELLMKAMSAWVERKKADPAGVDPAAVEEFETWLRERSALARQTRLMARETTGRAW